MERRISSPKQTPFMTQNDFKEFKRNTKEQLN
jgi:hypothetical protein